MKPAHPPSSTGTANCRPGRRTAFPGRKRRRSRRGDDARTYDYAPIAGTYWMHSHQGMQEQSLMSAPLIVHSAEDMRADRQEVVLMLHDFSFHKPEELLAGLTKSKASQNGMPKSGIGNNMNMNSMSMAPGSMGTMNMGSGM